MRLLSSTSGPVCAAMLIWGRESCSLKNFIRTGHVIASSNEATLNSSYCWEYIKTGLKSGFGIILTCPVPAPPHYPSGPQVPSSRGHKALNRGTLGGAFLGSYNISDPWLKAERVLAWASGLGKYRTNPDDCQYYGPMFSMRPLYITDLKYTSN